MAPPETFITQTLPNPRSEQVFDALKFKINDLSYINSPEGREFYEKNFSPPNFTIKELRDAIPPHLFKRSAVKSTLHLAWDMVICSALFYTATYLDSLPVYIQFAGWPLYWILQGIFMTGVWVIAHECGHQAYSDSKFINNFVGIILHSALLVPYHSWRISHAKHHASTGHLTEDQVFVPIRRSEYEESALSEAIETSPIYAIIRIFKILVIGWPAYLVFNASGQQYSKYTSHFHPTSPIFKPNHHFQILQSDFGLIVMLAIIGYASSITSFWTISKYYLIPYLNVNAWLVLITFLQHTDVYIPHYEPEKWNFVRGALTTVDRDFGWFLNTALHHINDSHVAHHLFSQMPFYNAVEATKHLKNKLGQYYLYDTTPLHLALMRAASECMFIENEGDIHFYRNK